MSNSWQTWLEHSLLPCLNACPVNLTVEAEAVWRSCLIDGSTPAGDAACCLQRAARRWARKPLPTADPTVLAAADGIDFELLKWGVVFWTGCFWIALSDEPVFIPLVLITSYTPSYSHCTFNFNRAKRLFMHKGRQKCTSAFTTTTYTTEQWTHW